MELIYRDFYMQSRTPIPRQPSLLIVRTDAHAVVFRLQEGQAQLLDKVPVRGPVGPALLPRILRCYVTPGQYGTCFVAGELPDVGDLGLPVLQIPARALFAAFQLLQQPIFV